ncbi:hypothetical protein KCU71_g187, partial [Aureobasidium melanogenum]
MTSSSARWGCQVHGAVNMSPRHCVMLSDVKRARTIIPGIDIGGFLIYDRIPRFALVAKVSSELYLLALADCNEFTGQDRLTKT